MHPCRLNLKKVLLSCALLLSLVCLFSKFSEPQSELTSTTKYQRTSSLHKRRLLKAFISSAYYYPTSKSLGDNAIALVLSINIERDPEDNLDGTIDPEPTELVISAKNATASTLIKTPYIRITPHPICRMVTVFATAQLLPNTQSIRMVGDNGMAEIPFKLPSDVQRDVIVCTSPLFVSEQWQNFLFAVHVYKKFGAHMNLYLISSVAPFYDLMKEYEAEGYMTIQPWVKAHFPGVPRTIADTFAQIEFRNQAAAQSDCLLQFKESARFITFLDLDDVLIPRIAPSYALEFERLMDGHENLAYITYHKENHEAEVQRDSSKFSLISVFGSLKSTHVRETGKIVLDPRNLNCTWIHFPPQLPAQMKTFEVTDNVITHLKNIVWRDSSNRTSNNKRIKPMLFNNSSAKIIEKDDILEIEADLRRMQRKPRIKKIYSELPTTHYFSDVISKCYNSRYYRYHLSGRISDIICPGPHMCDFTQNPKIKCMHVDAVHKPMETLSPITYYYATDAHFTADIGCYSH